VAATVLPNTPAIVWAGKSMQATPAATKAAPSSAYVAALKLLTRLGVPQSSRPRLCRIADVRGKGEERGQQGKRQE
jgi:hypothetical protein